MQGAGYLTQHPQALLRQFILITILVVPTSYVAVRPLRSTLQTAAQLSGVPIWPSNGVISKEISNQYVFYDPRTAECVIAYPANLGTSQFEKNPGKLVISRFATTRGARPSIQFSIVHDQEKYRYAYRVANGAGAKRPITSWYLATPVRPDGTLMAPSKWVTTTTRSSIDDAGNALGKPRLDGYVVFWFVQEEEASIATGKSLEGFSVVSSYKPGISAGYVRAGFFSMPSPDTFPDAVREQLGSLSSIAFSTESVLTVAPKFPGGTPRHQIAQDFHDGIRRMIAAGQLKEESALVRESLERLTPYFQNAETFKNVPFTLNQRAANPLEISLQGVLTLAMN